MQHSEPTTVVATLIVLFLGIGFHEYAHAKFADLAGDPTPRYFGRVTLDLTKHFELMGTIMMIVMTVSGFGFGWGKPCPMNPSKMRNPRWDHFVAVLAGPVSNLVQALVYGTVFRIILAAGSSALLVDRFAGNLTFVGLLLQSGVIVNLTLCAFNLIPLGPLDGHWLVGAFLPPQARLHWYRFNQTTGTLILFGIIFLGSSLLSKFLGPIVGIGFKLITGLG